MEKSINLIPYSIPLSEPISISFSTFNSYEGFFLVSGESVGEAAPFKPITGDTKEEGIKQFFSGAEPTSSTLLAALDFLEHDIVSREKGVPVYKLYRDNPNLVPNSVTVFLKNSADETEAEASRLITKFPHTKLIKIKLKGEGDFERCKAVKNGIGKKVSYVLDANQGFNDENEAIRTLAQIFECLEDVILVEEPCKKGELLKAKKITESFKDVCIAADESCCSLLDLEEIIKEKAFSGINIKLQKCGGIKRGLKLANLAKDFGLSVMVGQMFETQSSTSAGVHFASILDNCLFTDLDMDLELPPIFKEICPFIDGKRVPIEAPGFGINFSSVDKRYLG